MIALVVPTRGRPGNAARLLAAVTLTELGPLRVILAVDPDDKYLPEYLTVSRRAPLEVHVTVATKPRTPRSSSHAAGVNRAAERAFVDPAVTCVIKLDDDHVPVTPGWATALAAAAGPWGMAWPSDGHPSVQLPTVCAMGRSLWAALGGRMLPRNAMQHLFTDNYWQRLAEEIGAHGYLGTVLVEHMHAHLGKAPSDAGYEHVNSPLRWQRDGTAWQEYRQAGRLAADVKRVREAMDAA